ncbi:hypothetical protein AB0C28_52535 [Nonomuraea sp. NPDC048892]|uniref:hypothetical protein n=1 Tax=Nonomuraea sp. NPDC048892 TaxID=3154624 RepID=UPI0033E13218
MLTQVALGNYQEADVIITASGLNPWLAAAGAWCLAGLAFDKLYPPDGKGDEK